MSRRVALGRLGDGTIGLRIAKAGYDAETASPDPTQLIFDSNWPALLPIHQSGVITCARNATVTVNFPQLSYSPLFMTCSKGSENHQYVGFIDATTWVVNRNCANEFSSYNNSTPYPYFQTWVTSSTISCYLYDNMPAGQPTAPAVMTLAYVIFKLGS